MSNEIEKLLESGLSAVARGEDVGVEGAQRLRGDEVLSLAAACLSKSCARSIIALKSL